MNKFDLKMISVARGTIGTSFIPKKGSNSRPEVLQTRPYSRTLLTYCRLLTNPFVCVMMLLLLGFYLFVSIVGVLNINPELVPYKLFIADSPLVKVSGNFDYPFES